MTPIETLLSKLPDAKKASKGWLVCCPAHDDQRASLSVSEGEDGRALVKCHAGCSAQEVVSALGLTLRDLMPECANTKSSRTTPHEPKAQAFETANHAVEALERRHGKRSAVWKYHDASGNPVGLVVRWNSADGKKDIRPVSKHADGWQINAMPEPRPLYALPKLATAKRVLVVEGEKCVDAAHEIGFIATTSVGGSQAAKKTVWGPLAGKEIWVLPDNDEPGRKYAETVTQLLSKLTPLPTVKVVHLPGLPDGGDIVDWIACNGTVSNEALRCLLEQLAEDVEPEEIAKPTGDSERFQPFPVEVLPEPIRGFVGAGARAIGCDESYVAMPLLIEIAAAIGNARRLELKRNWVCSRNTLGSDRGREWHCKDAGVQVGHATNSGATAKIAQTAWRRDQGV